MIATKKSDLRIITYVVYVHKDLTDSVIDGYTHIDEENDNPIKQCGVHRPSEKEWEEYLTFTLQGIDEDNARRARMQEK